MIANNDPERKEVVLQVVIQLNAIKSKKVWNRYIGSDNYLVFQRRQSGKNYTEFISR